MRLDSWQINEFVTTVMKAQVEKDFSWIDREFLVESWVNSMDAGPGVAYGITESGGPIGFLLGIHTHEPMTGIKKAFEYLWMVSPQKRSGAAALRLLKEFEAGAKQDGCVNVVLGSHIAFKRGVLGRWYRWLGYESISESFQKRI